MLALTMLFILIYTASGRRNATPIATTVASTAASTASAAAAAATTSDYPPRSCCYCSCWSALAAGAGSRSPCASVVGQM